MKILGFFFLGFVYCPNPVGRGVLQKLWAMGHEIRREKKKKNLRTRGITPLATRGVERCIQTHPGKHIALTTGVHRAAGSAQSRDAGGGEREGREAARGLGGGAGWRARPTAEAARGAQGGALALTRSGALHGRGAEETKAETRGARGGGGAGRGGQACGGAEPRKAQHPRRPPLREEPEGADQAGRGNPDWGPGSGGGAVPGAALGSDLWQPSVISCGAALPVPRLEGRDWDQLKAFLGLLSLENPSVWFSLEL